MWGLSDFFTSLASSPSHANATSTFRKTTVAISGGTIQACFKVTHMLLPSICLIFETKDLLCNENILFSILYIILTDLTFYKYHINFLCHGQYIFKRLWTRLSVIIMAIIRNWGSSLICLKITVAVEKRKSSDNFFHQILVVRKNQPFLAMLRRKRRELSPKYQWRIGKHFLKQCLKCLLRNPKYLTYSVGNQNQLWKKEIKLNNYQDAYWNFESLWYINKKIYIVITVMLITS